MRSVNPKPAEAAGPKAPSKFVPAHIPAPTEHVKELPPHHTPPRRTFDKLSKSKEVLPPDISNLLRSELKEKIFGVSDLWGYHRPSSFDQSNSSMEIAHTMLPS